MNMSNTEDTTILEGSSRLKRASGSGVNNGRKAGSMSRTNLLNATKPLECGGSLDIRSSRIGANNWRTVCKAARALRNAMLSPTVSSGDTVS